jgi:hypothetical protein
LHQLAMVAAQNVSLIFSLAEGCHHGCHIV